MNEPAELIPRWVRWLTAYNRAWFTALLKRFDEMERNPPIRPRVFRSSTEAARYCGFARPEHFLVWANRVGFEIPKTRLVKQTRLVFLIDDLDAAILRDPALCRNRRNR